MRDRLIELLKKADEYASGVCTDYDEAQEVCADYLLAEGVIVPPCKVGAEIYWIGDKERVVKTFFVKCVEINIFDKRIHTVIHTVMHKKNFYSDRHFSNYQFGTNLFFTREEAEQALERREG